MARSTTPTTGDVTDSNRLAIGFFGEKTGNAQSRLWAVKPLFVILTFSGQASRWAGIAADMGFSLVVIANAVRLLRAKG